MDGKNCIEIDEEFPKYEPELGKKLAQKVLLQGGGLLMQEIKSQMNG